MRAAAILLVLACLPMAFLVGVLMESGAGRDAEGLLGIYIGTIIAASATTIMTALAAPALARSRGTALVSTMAAAFVASGLVWAGWVAGYSLSDGYLCGDGDCKQPVTYVAIWLFGTILTVIPVVVLGLVVSVLLIRQESTPVGTTND